MTLNRTLEIKSFLPTATHLLFFINLLVYFFHPDGWPFELGSIREHYWPIIGSMFSHASVNHLMGNMLFLVLFGPIVEKRMGWLPFVGLYLASGVASLWGFGLFYPEMRVVGASGAISGLMAVYPFVQTNWLSKLLTGVCVGFLLFSEFAKALVIDLPRTAHLGHVAGAVSGLLVFCYYRAMHGRTSR